MNVTSVRAAVVAVLLALTPVPSLEQRLPPVPKAYDVIVAGSTPAGIAAALSAAQRGMRVLYLAEEPELGGVLTRGMLTHWDLQHTKQGKLLEGGIFAEFYQALPNGFSPSTAARYFEDRIRSQPRITLLAGVRNYTVTTVAAGNDQIRT